MIPDIDPNSPVFTTTHSWLQDISKVVGKFQQVFVPKHPLDWQTGLLIKPNQISTQPFQFNGHETALVFDVPKEELTFDQDRWSEKGQTAQQLFDTLQSWLQSQKQSAMAQPELVNKTEHDASLAQDLVTVLAWAAQALEQHKAQMPAEDTSPVLLYPHHFDESFSWYPKGMAGAKNTDDQRGYGFSLGDDYIKSPYFYITAYPEPSDFQSQQLPAEAHWQKEGFSGAVLMYEAVSKHPEPEKLVQTFLQAVR